MLPGPVLEISLHVEVLAFDLAEVQHFLISLTEPFLLASLIYVLKAFTNRGLWPIEIAELPGDSLLL